MISNSLKMIAKFSKIRYVHIVIWILLLFSIKLHAQEIPNSSFEMWENLGEYENPEFWDTGNVMNSGVGVITTYKTEDANSGNFAAKLETKSFLTFTIPGLITLGNFEVDIWTQQSSITGGIPFNLRPDKMKVYYKYNPADGDNLRIGMWLLRDDGSEIPDTVGTALFESQETVNEYTQLVMDIEYRSDEVPEILNIIAVSSNPDNPVAGSILFIDDFLFECSTGIINLVISDDIVYPNPVNDVLFINPDYKGNQIEVLNNKGQIIIQHKSRSSEQIDVSVLQPGAYFIRIYQPENNSVINQKIIKL